MRPHLSNIFFIAITVGVLLVTVEYYNRKIDLLNTILIEHQDELANLRKYNDRKDNFPVSDPQPIENPVTPPETPEHFSLVKTKLPLCVVSTFHDPKAAEYTLPYFLEYTTTWAYPFFFYHSNKYASSFEKYKFKLRLIERYFEHCEWIAWIDSDIIITNFSIPLESFIDTRYDFLAAGPHTKNKNIKWELNAGFMFVRSSDWIRNLFAQVYLMTTTDDQAALDILLNKAENEHKSKVIPWKQLQQPYTKNAVGTWKRGDFCIHFWGYDKRLLDQFIEEQRDYLNNETYPFEPFELGKYKIVEKWKN